MWKCHVWFGQHLSSVCLRPHFWCVLFVCVTCERYLWCGFLLFWLCQKQSCKKETRAAFMDLWQVCVGEACMWIMLDTGTKRQRNKTLRGWYVSCPCVLDWHCINMHMIPQSVNWTPFAFQWNLIFLVQDRHMTELLRFLFHKYDVCENKTRCCEFLLPRYLWTARDCHVANTY